MMRGCVSVGMGFTANVRPNAERRSAEAVVAPDVRRPYPKPASPPVLLPARAVLFRPLGRRYIISCGET